MQKYRYQLRTLSSLIVSPRSNSAIYLDDTDSIPDFVSSNNEFLDAKKLRIVYPFYRYGEYNIYDPRNAQYYLPGSTIKGALCKTNIVPTKPLNLLVDDIPIPNDWIALRNLYKAQYLDTPDQASFGAFFENVGVEMVKADKSLLGEFYVGNDTPMDEVWKATTESTKAKILQMLKYLQQTQGIVGKNGFQQKLGDVMKNLSDLQSKENILLLGGYKGFLHSLCLDQWPQEPKSAVFVDKKTMLPHGFAEFTLL